MNVLVAVDSFKGSASSRELNSAISNRLQTLDFVKNVETITISDGGEGTTETIYDALGGEKKNIQTIDLLGRKINFEYLEFTFEKKRFALVESASIVGLDLIEPSPDTILKSSSRGLGVAIKKIIDKGILNIIVSLGGTGVSDGGLGLLQEFGAIIYDENGDEIVFGNPLMAVDKIDMNNLEIPQKYNLVVANDVNNQYYGENGAAYTFAKQKGASNLQIELLDQKAMEIREMVLEQLEIDMQNFLGGGAAGGLGAALALLDGQMINGFTLISDLIKFPEKVKKSDIIITGEGSIDQQSLMGKVPYSMGIMCQEYKKTIIAICGKKDQRLDENTIFDGIFCIQQQATSLEEAMKTKVTTENAASTVYNILKTINSVL